MITVGHKTRLEAVIMKLFIRRTQGFSYSRIRHYVALGNGYVANTTTRQVGRKAALGFKSLRNPPPIFSTGSVTSRDLLTSAATNSSVDQDDESLETPSPDLTEMEEVSFEHSVNAESDDDDMAHLRVKLYELQEDDRISEYLERLYEAASIQQVFDIVEEQDKCDGKINLKVASQALVTVWDLQKLLFRISANFDPERDYFDRPTFIEKVAGHPVFLQKIVKPVIENCEALDDNPFLACLLCLKRMHYDMRGPECQRFVEESLRRKETLSLPSVSRLFVCLRTEGLYGMFVCANFYPLLNRYIDTMSSDLEVRLVAISLRNTFRISTDSIVEKFQDRISELIADMKNWETVTLCKVFLVLILCRNTGEKSRLVYDAVGEALIERVPTMQIMDLLSLQRFLEHGFIHPYGLVEALVKRMMRIVQEGMSTTNSPRLDLLASVAPHLKTVPQRKQLALMLEDYLENHNFELASGILFSILRWSRTSNVKLYDLFWMKAAEYVGKLSEENILEKRVLKLGRDYVNFVYGLSFGYRNRYFESKMKSYLYNLFDNYSKGLQPCFVGPGDFSRALAFIIGCATLNDPLFQKIDVVRTLDDFAPQFRSGDLVILSRGLESIILNLFYPKKHTAKSYERILEICSILEEQCTRILIDNQQNVEFGELLAIHKSALVTRRVKGETPLLDVTMQRIVQSDIADARAIKDLAQHLINGWNNYPEANQKIENFIWNSRGKAISPELIEKFVSLAFCVGWEANNNNVFGFCSSEITKNWDKLSFLGLLQSSLGLCFYRSMTNELVQNIFSVDFLDHLDSELSSSYRSNQYPLKLRQAMMELNRAVCIDMPDTNLPWFHEKFCEELLALNKLQETYLHREVRKVLGEVVGDDAAVQANICSPYYYYLDFLIEFDEKGRPIKKNRHTSRGFFQKFRENVESVKVGRKVAVLILPRSSFTKSVRSVKGQLKLRRRHLEILGYDVIEIDPMYWNSMFMSENTVRHNFLESKLYAKACAVG